MINEIHLKPQLIGRKWVVYFDILGFGRFVEDNPPESIFDRYAMCLEEFKHHEAYNPILNFVHFSDSFLIYAPDDTRASFAAIDSSARWFFNIVLLKRIPLRGAMACDQFYADKANGVFFGKALVEAAQMEKNINWIGFVLCRSASDRMADTDVNLPVSQRINYREWNVPTKQGLKPTVAYLIGASSPQNNENTYIPILEELREQARDPGVKEMYNNTTQFLKHYGVLLPVKRNLEQ
jgi:hypothetical protein